MRVLMIGGAGYIGSACFRAFRKQGIEAFVVDDLSTGNSCAVESDRLHVMDVRDTEQLATLIRDLNIDSIIHFAALASVPNSLHQPAEYWSVNVQGTYSLLVAMMNTGVKRLVFSSTAAVYDLAGQSPFREDDALRPATPYGSSKLAAEYLIRDFARAYLMTAVALRYFNACGADADGMHGEARRDETHVCPLLMEVAVGNRPHFSIFGTDLDTRDGTCIRDMVSVQDLVQAHLLGLTCSLVEPFTVCNLGSGGGTSVLELLEKAREVTGRPIPHRVAEPRAGDPAVLIADISAAQRVLGWQPVCSDEASFLETAWKWHSNHPNGYAR